MPKLSQPVDYRKQLAKALAESKAKGRTTSLWRGPLDDGITQSMLNRFLCCRERFRLYVVEGLKVEGFNHRLEYGNMWHLCEEQLAGTNIASNVLGVKPHPAEWEPKLKQYAVELTKQYPQNGPEIEKWWNVCRRQFPIYVDYWRKHPDVKNAKPLYAESVFDVRYKLPSGRVIRLRGKLDKGDIVTEGKVASIFIQENKSKSEIDADKTVRELPLNLQTGIYLTALAEVMKDKTNPLYKVGFESLKIGGVRYNEIRRPLSGWGEGNIKQRKGVGKAKKGAETLEEFYDRLGQLIADDPAKFFIRVKMKVTLSELEKFQQRVLNPILEQLCDWWESIKDDPFNPWESQMSHVRSGKTGKGPNHLHYVYPYGIFNVVAEGGSSPYDDYILRGDLGCLTRTESLFRELAV